MKNEESGLLPTWDCEAGYDPEKVNVRATLTMKHVILTVFYLIVVASRVCVHCAKSTIESGYFQFFVLVEGKYCRMTTSGSSSG